MRAAPAVGQAPSLDAGLRRRSHVLISLGARLQAASLDRQLAAGVPSWRSPRHAARAIQLTSPRRRGASARALEELIERTEQRVPRGRSAAIPPCRDQVRDALAEIMEISARLRSAEPVGARGVAMVRELLSDGGGPCFRPADPHALREALQEISKWLSVTS